MKKITSLILIVFSLFAVNSCEDGIEGTEDLNYVTFEAASLNLGVDIDGTNEHEVKVYTTNVTGSDRTYTINVIEDQTTAEEGAYSVPSSVTVPANTNSGTFNVTLNDVNIGSGKVLALDIAPEEGLYKGKPAVINITQICRLNDVKLNLIFDGYASETTWNLVNEAGDLIAEGGPYADGDAGAATSFCLEDGTYTFTIEDLYGDGLSYPENGSATLSIGTQQLGIVEGDFGTSATITFTVPVE